MTEQPPKMSPFAFVALGAALGFIIGLVGPAVVRPDLPQGPLLALLTTPLGAALGTAWALFRR